MKTHTFKTPVFLYVLLGCIAFSPLLQAKTDVFFNGQGLSSIQVEGVERLHSIPRTIWLVKQASGSGLRADPSSRSFDPGSRTLTETYPWGTIRQVYHVLPEGLQIHMTVENHSEETITELRLNSLKLTGLGQYTKGGGSTAGVAGPPFLPVVGPEGSIVYSLDSEPRRPVKLLTSVEADAIPVKVILGGEELLVDNVTAEHRIEPGAGTGFRLGFRFGGPGSDPFVVAEDFIESCRKEHPMVLEWPDRRLMIRLFFGGGVSREVADHNLQHPDDVVPPEPDEKFRQRILSTMRNTVEAAKAGDAQGVIVWDLEGGTYPHATTYIGDPRHIRLLNPQMDLVIDEAFQILKDAGLKIGITLRTSRVVYNEEKKTTAHSHTVAEDPFRELDAKVAYAKERWGCEIFYVDTNYFWRPYGPKQEWKAGRVPPELWVRLVEKYPDTLFIPEFGNIGDYQAAAIYGEADMGNYKTPELARVLWPESFRFIVIEDADPYLQFERFVETVRDRNALMTFGSNPDAKNVQASVLIYREAGWLDEGMPRAVERADASELTSLLASDEAKVRFYAARKLREHPADAAAADLFALARNPEEIWNVRRQALHALGEISSPAGIEDMIAIFSESGSGLQPAVAVALKGQGEAAAEPVLNLLSEQVAVKSRDLNRLPVLTRLLLDVAPKEAGLRLHDLVAQVPLFPSTYHQRVNQAALIEAIGRFGHPGSEDYLASLLNDDSLQEAAAEALVSLGTENSRSRVQAALESAKANNNQEAVKRFTAALKKN
ncbi:MAG: HEAT repeat domain-containing protein [Kiritimatiellia bacterium]